MAKKKHITFILELSNFDFSRLELVDARLIISRKGGKCCSPLDYTVSLAELIHSLAHSPKASNCALWQTTSASGLSKRSWERSPDLCLW